MPYSLEQCVFVKFCIRETPPCNLYLSIPVLLYTVGHKLSITCLISKISFLLAFRNGKCILNRYAQTTFVGFEIIL